MSFSAVVYGLGNIGRFAVEALEAAPDAQCLGVIRRRQSLGMPSLDQRGLPAYASLDELVAAKGRPDTVLLCTPSRQVPDAAAELLSRGFNTVDSFDIHDRIPETLARLDQAARQGGAVAGSAAGWDPGTDSVLRALFEAMVPAGTTFTNFGRGRSMGHSVAVRALPGVADAVAITIPDGGGRHSRLVYVVLEKGARFDDVRASIAADPYFSHDPLEVREVSAAELPFVADASHGVLLERTGASGLTANQHLSFDMRINNPALTAQVMVAVARAVTRRRARGEAGAFTLLDIAPVDLLPGERLSHIARLV